MAATIGAVLLVGITLYAVLGGADFGGGLWDLLAGGTSRGWAPRRLIDESITPVWEANHVWLIFDLVIFWTAFPHAFASVMTAAGIAPLARRRRCGPARRRLRLSERNQRSSTLANRRRHLRSILPSDSLLHGHGHRRCRHRWRPGGRHSRQPVLLDERNCAADRILVRGRLWVPRRRLPLRRSHTAGGSHAANLLRSSSSGRRHHRRGACR